MHKQQQQQQQQQERLSSGSLAAAYCIGLLTPTTSHTAATIALDYSHILFQLHLQCGTNIIWNWWQFGKKNPSRFWKAQSSHWFEHSGLIYDTCPMRGAWFVFTMCVRKVLNIGSQSPRKSGGEDSHQKSFSSSALAGKSYICDTRNQFLAQ